MLTNIPPDTKFTFSVTDEVGNNQNIEISPAQITYGVVSDLIRFADSNIFSITIKPTAREKIMVSFQLSNLADHDRKLTVRKISEERVSVAVIDDDGWEIINPEPARENADDEKDGV